jgi:MoxR-like ATPase
MIDLVPDVLRHRIVLSYEAMSQGLTQDGIVSLIMRAVPAPNKPLEHIEKAAHEKLAA